MRRRRRVGNDRLTRALLRCGLAAGPVFMGVAAIEGRRRPAYRALRHPISSLSLGARGRVQVVNFMTTGALCGAFARGLARTAGASRSAPWLVALPSVGLLACGLFPADPVNGYPPGTPLSPEHMTGTGYAHLVASSAIMVSVPATTALHARRAWRSGDRPWAAGSLLATGLTAASFGGACAGFAQLGRLPAVAGLLQRVAVGTGFTWLAALAVRTLRSAQRPPRP